MPESEAPHALLLIRAAAKLGAPRRRFVSCTSVWALAGPQQLSELLEDAASNASNAAESCGIAYGHWRRRCQQGGGELVDGQTMSDKQFQSRSGIKCMLKL